MRRFLFAISLPLFLSLSHCGALASLANSIRDDCEDFANSEDDSALNEACRELEDFFESDQDNLASKTEILSVRTAGGSRDAVLLITDAGGNPITGLGTDQITAEKSSDDGSTFESVPLDDLDTFQQLAESEAGQTHFSFASIIDYSGSIFDDDLGFVTDALTFVYEELPAVYRSEVVKFSTDVQVTQSYTSDRDALLSAVEDESYTREFTSMYDGMKEALEDTAEETTSFRFAILFTDGLDNDSTATYDDVKEIFQENEIPVCVVGVSFADVTVLQQIADDSGCFFIYRALFDDLEEAFEKIVDQIENLYRIRFDADELEGFDTLRLTITTSEGTRQATADL